MLTIESLVRIVKKPMGIIRIDDTKLSFVEINEALCLISGFSKADLMKLDPSVLLTEDRSAPPASELAQLRQRQYIRKEISIFSQNKSVVFFEVEAYRMDDGDERLLIVFAENICAKKWIEKQIERSPVLCSGILNSSNYVERFDVYFDPQLRSKAGFEHMSVFELIAAEDHPKIRQALDEIRLTRQTKELVLRTSRLAYFQQELELKMTMCPFFDGFGAIQEYGFVVSQLQPYEETAEPSVKLKVIMAQKNISAQNLSEATGISAQTISKLRNGKIARPQLLTAQVIASELGVHVADIWTSTRK
ncbi:helix-turn-helix protein [Paenibacillus konkukensis]|uniref:Helix-turn-helix protein n=1 Tax=Paenibacillus konkukensis TaxID=2020716 RepID=A0ABY4RP64_9BACL|nr:helix-turn-helix domain-containing protein [Paenibacillus konkukensis]UQZ83755.1 helix-turn-helix protein [Paenibacillus konkukensis]